MLLLQWEELGILLLKHSTGTTVVYWFTDHRLTAQAKLETSEVPIENSYNWKNIVTLVFFFLRSVLQLTFLHTQSWSWLFSVCQLVSLWLKLLMRKIFDQYFEHIRAYMANSNLNKMLNRNFYKDLCIILSTNDAEQSFDIWEEQFLCCFLKFWLKFFTNTVVWQARDTVSGKESFH